MHVIQVGSQWGVECEVQTVGIGVTFQSCADVVGVQFDAYIVPTCCFCRQFGIGERGVDSVLGVHERYLSCLYAQSVHLERLERQCERRTVLFCRVGRADEHVEVVLAVRRDKEVHLCTGQSGFVDVQVLIRQELAHIHCGNHMFGFHNSVVLRSLHRVDEQQSVGAQSEARESGEECQIDFTNLVLAGNELCCGLPGDRCQPCRREHYVHCNACHKYDSQHNAQQRPTDDLQGFFHFVSTTLVKLYFQFSLPFS